MANVSYLVPPGKIRCFITAKLRPDTPEENVRQRWARSLVEEYGYPKSDIGVEVKVQMGRARKRVDLAVHKPDAPHGQENVLIYVECKRDDRSLSEADDGQFKSYIAASAQCNFGMLVGQERRAFEKMRDGTFERIPDIPRHGYSTPKQPTRNALVRTHELSSVFRRCHNYIYANAGEHGQDAFHEFIKLIFCKTFDEEESGEELRFGVDPRERTSESGQRKLLEDRILPLFERVKRRYPFIFEETDRINLEPKVVAYVVSELQYISLLDTDIDVKGSAYEELVGANLRGDRGEFFTPRNVCDMAVQMAMHLHDRQDLTGLQVMDCCCGTGGFLVSWLNHLHGILLEQETERPLSKGTPEERARRRVHAVCKGNLFGLDIGRKLVRACQMNLVLHGDGSSNIFRADSTRSPGEWDSMARQSIPFGKIDVLFTNPPFGGGGKIDDGHVLGQYELPGWECGKSPRSSMPAEQLFVEAALRFVKPEGYLVIVLPDGIVNNPGLRFIRSWLLKRTRIIASVALPKTTFASSNGINNPTVLILQKLGRKEIEQAEASILPEAYEVFMSVPETAGVNSRNKPIYLHHPNGQEVVDENGNKIRNDEIRGVAEVFRNWRMVE